MACPRVRLDKVAEVAAGNPAPQEPGDFDDDGALFIRMQDVGREHRTASLTTSTDKLSNAAITTYRLRLFPAGSVLIPKSGASVNLNHRAMLGCDAYVVSHLSVIIPDRQKLLPEYLYYWSLSYDPRSQAQTTSLPSLPLSLIKAAPIPVPAIDEQRRIVDLLSRAEGIVRLRHEAEKKTAELIPALFLDMFGDPATNPKGWEVALLPNVLARPFKNGLYLPKERYAPEGTNLGVEMVHMSDAFYGEVKRGGLRRVFAEGKQVDDYNLTKTDLLVARRSLNFDGAAKLCGIPEHDQPLLFESSFIRLTPNLDRVRTEYLLHYLNNEHTRKAFVLSRISGITISGINQAALNSIPVMVPPCQIQDQFVGKVDQARAIETQQSAAAAKAHSAFDALLARAFSFDEVLQ